jgi:proteasome lid subunit RPN8/RPN11
LPARSARAEHLKKGRIVEAPQDVVGLMGKVSHQTPMPLKLNHAQIEAIRQHAAQDYPSECCGVMLGKANGVCKQVDEIVPLENLRNDPARAQLFLPVDDPARETERNRFLLDPLDQLRVEKDARARGLEVLGYYHSHPDHPARPSTYDRERAWPWYSYVIVSVERGSAKDLTSWVLAEEGGNFWSEQIEVVE